MERSDQRPMTGSHAYRQAGAATECSSTHFNSYIRNTYCKNYMITNKEEHPKPVWTPSAAVIEEANVTAIQRKLGLNDYKELHRWSVTHRLEFWELMVHTLGISFQKPYQQIAEVKDGHEHSKWLPGAVFNIADSCFNTASTDIAIIYQAEKGDIQKMTYRELEALTNRVANGLRNMGLKKGDAIAIDMPMTAEAIAIYLGIVKLGGAVVSVADSLAPAEVAKRLKIANTKAIFTQDVIHRAGKVIPLYDKLLEIELPPAIVLPATQQLDVDVRDMDKSWDDFLSENTRFESVSCTAEDYCNILFSSGTTGDPKAIPWTHATPVKCASDGYLHHDLKKGDVVAWPTNIGWMMGPWLIFAGLINRCTIALYYGAPTGRDFGEFVQDAKVNMLGVVPSMVKRWIETDCMKGLNWSSIKIFSSTGESSNAQDYRWLMDLAGSIPVIEYCGGTEIGGGYITGTVVQPAFPSTFTTPALGLDILILDEKGQSAESGEMFIVPPSIGLSASLLNKNHHEVYYQDVPIVDGDFKGVFGTPLNEQGTDITIRRHGDELEKLPDGYFRALGRADDTMNLGGIKTSSVEIERLLDELEEVTETAAVAISPIEGGPGELVIYTVLKKPLPLNTDALKSRFQETLKSRLNPLFRIKKVILTDVLPRTASNKIMRRVLRDNYHSSREEPGQ